MQILLNLESLYKIKREINYNTYKIETERVKISFKLRYDFNFIFNFSGKIKKPANSTEIRKKAYIKRNNKLILRLTISIACIYFKIKDFIDVQ